MKRIKIQLPIFLYLTVLVNFDPAFAGSLKQLWNKLKYDNQRLDYYQPYAPFNNYLPASSVNYPSSLSNFNVMNTPLIESASLQRPIVSLPSNMQPQTQQQQSNLKSLPSNNIPAIMPSNLPNNLMTAESINNQFGVLPQLPPIHQLPPELLYDFNMKPNGYSSLDGLRNLNGIGQSAGLPSLTSLTPLLLLSSLGTLSSKSLGHSGVGPLTPSVSNSFLKSLTTYLTSYLPASPRQRKRQIDRNLPTYSLKKSMTPFDQYTTFQQSLTPLGSSPKVSSTIYEANMKKHLYFNKKRPVKYIKPKWKMDAHKKAYNLKKPNKNQIKYSKLMNESGFMNKQNQTSKFSNNQKRPQHQQMKYSEPDSYLNKQKSEDMNKDENKQANKDQLKSAAQEDQTNSRSTNDQQNDKQTEKVNDKSVNDAKLNDAKLNEESTATEFRSEQQEGHSDLTSNQPQTDLEDIAEKLYR